MRAGALKTYRWIVFLAACYFVGWILTNGSFSVFGGPFRFLTNWALVASLVTAGQLLLWTYGLSDRRADGLVGLTAVLNGMVVLMYWKLFLADPYSVGDTDRVSWVGFYLHGIGPALQWIDALFIHRSFRRPLHSAALLTGTITVYVLWIEQVVSRFAETPSGSITSGLPYPFLNNLGPTARATFYGSNIGGAMLLLAVLTALAWFIRRLLGPEVPRVPSGSRDTAGERRARP